MRGRIRVEPPMTRMRSRQETEPRLPNCVAHAQSIERGATPMGQRRACAVDRRRSHAYGSASRLRSTTGLRVRRNLRLRKREFVSREHDNSRNLTPPKFREVVLRSAI